MNKCKLVIVSLFISISLMFIYGCSFEQGTRDIEDQINKKVDQTRQDVSNKVQAYVEDTVSTKIDSTVKSIESTIDPKLGEIRKNMNNIKESALIYYKINKTMPIQQKIEPLFPVPFKDMKIQYKVSNDSQRAFIMYIGKDYSKDKVGEIIVEPDKN